MLEMQKNAGTFDIVAKRIIDRKRTSGEFKASKTFDVLKQYSLDDHALHKKNGNKAFENSKDVIACIMAETENIVESKHGFGKKIQKLEQEKIDERKELEKQIENLKTGTRLSLYVKLLKETKSEKDYRVSQMLDEYRLRNFPVTPEGYEKEEDNLIQKFNTSQKEKDESIKKLRSEKSAYQKQYQDLLLGLFKSSSVIESAKQLEAKKFRHDIIVATTASLNNGTLDIGSGFGELIKNLTKAVLEGKL